MKRIAALLVLPLALTLFLPTVGMAEEGQVVGTRAPDRTGAPVLNKFFVKNKRLEIDVPIIGYLGSNPFIDDLHLGMGLAYHFNERLALEVAASYGIMGLVSGENNFKKIVDAAVGLVNDTADIFRLETSDPELQASVSVLWSPMYGKLNPFGLAVINLDFYFFGGVGAVTDRVKLARLDLAKAGELGILEAVHDPEQGGIRPSFMVNIGAGLKIYVTRSFALRVDARFYLTAPRVPDYRDESNRSINQQFEGAEGRPPNRIDCSGNTSVAPAACVTTLNSTFIISVSPSFWVPKAPERQKATLIRR